MYVLEVFVCPFASFSFVHCVVCPSSIYDFDYPFGIFKLVNFVGFAWSFSFALYCLRLRITFLVSNSIFSGY